MEKIISVGIRELAEFLFRSGSIDARFSGLNRAVEGGKIHRMLQKQAGKNYEAEVTLSYLYKYKDIEYMLSGRADGVIKNQDKYCIDEIKTTTKDLDAIEKETFPAHWAQAKIYAFIWCKKNNLNHIEVQLTYYNVDNDTKKYIVQSYTLEELETFMQKISKSYYPWILLSLKWKEKRNASLQKLVFPFDEYRRGQRKMIIAVYKSIQEKQRVLCCAPTGIGKTISSIFPSMKAIGEGYGERLFYLTAKTITRTTAQEALFLLKEKNPNVYFKSITLTAKDKICMLEERNCIPEVCPYANGYYDRINTVLYNLLKKEESFTREKIEKIARENKLCPYELSLDISSWCDCVICDYNYLFDPVVKLKRFFENSDKENIFLIDEAHNLPDRAREMYSAKLNKRDFFDFKKGLPKKFKQLQSTLKQINDGFIELRHRAEDENMNTLTLVNVPEELKKPINKFIIAAEEFLEQHAEPTIEKELLILYFSVLFYRRISESFTKAYNTLIFIRKNGDVVVKLFCMDPSDFIDESLSCGRSSILFSATLLPLDYYNHLLGATQAKRLFLESPFKKENLGLFINNAIGTKYTQRDYSLQEIVNMVYSFINFKNGNYIVYFPSYAYMNSVYHLFEEQHPDIFTIMQSNTMDESERESFLENFSNSKETNILAFCVLGGIFSEGIDLVGDKLIGSIIVGVGLPQINEEQNSLKMYYDEEFSQGFAYAYQYPGMNKVLQAAGRVIRTAEDKGVVLLIDERFTDRRYLQLFPPHWQHWQTTTKDTIQKQLEDFWGNSKMEKS